MRDVVEIEGMEQLIHNLRELPTLFQRVRLSDATDQGGALLELAMASTAPKLTGELAANVEREMTKQTRTVAEVAVGPAKHVFWGVFQELGTEHQEPNPWMRPAYDATRDDIVEVVAEELEQGIEEWLRRVDNR